MGPGEMAPSASGATVEPPSADWPADLPVRVGDVVAEKYAIEGLLGAGGVGVVLEARHTTLGERVAVKVLQADASRSEELLTRFAREARALARIRSEHVARVMDAGTLATGEPFMVLEHLDGCDLGQLVATRGALPIADAVDHVVQACEGVVVAHALGVIHRDLKPANLFVVRAADGSPTVKVLDFGISKLRLESGDEREHAVTQSTSVIGSPLYMSPEQMQTPRDVDERADVWSLATILYELVTGKPPFEAPSLPLLCANICTAPFVPFADRGVVVSAQLGEAIARGLAKQREDRFPSVASFALAIASFGSDATRALAARIERIARRESMPLESSASDSDAASSSRPSLPLVDRGSSAPIAADIDEPRTFSRGRSRRGVALAALAALFGLLAMFVWRAPQDAVVASARVEARDGLSSGHATLGAAPIVSAPPSEHTLAASHASATQPLETTSSSSAAETVPTAPVEPRAERAGAERSPSKSRPARPSNPDSAKKPAKKPTKEAGDVFSER
jgi:serine/threonine protein kinase